jgi:hypothetical protein
MEAKPRDKYRVVDPDSLNPDPSFQVNDQNFK